MNTRILSILTGALMIVPAAPLFAYEGQDGSKPDEPAKDGSSFKEILDALNKLQEGKENQIKPAETTGQFEIEVLGLKALGVMVGALKDSICSGDLCDNKDKQLLVLGNETYAFGQANQLILNVNDLGDRFIKLPSTPASLRPFIRGDEEAVKTAAFPVEFIGAIGQVAQLFRNEVTLKEVGILGIDDAMLARALAAALNAEKDNVRAQVLSGSPGVRLDFEKAPWPNWNRHSELANKVIWLLTFKAVLEKLSSPNDAQKKWTTDFDEFYKSVTEVKDEKPSLLATSITADSIEGDLQGIIQLKIVSKGGTQATHKNFGSTVLGLDPVRVSGGLTATYTYYDATANQRARPMRWGAITCSTDDMKMDKVRGTKFEMEDADSAKDTAICSTVVQFPPPR